MPQDPVLLHARYHIMRVFGDLHKPFYLYNLHVPHTCTAHKIYLVCSENYRKMPKIEHQFTLTTVHGC